MKVIDLIKNGKLDYGFPVFRGVMIEPNKDHTEIIVWNYKEDVKMGFPNIDISAIFLFSNGKRTEVTHFADNEISYRETIAVIFSTTGRFNL